MNRIVMTAVLSAAAAVNASAQESAGWGRVTALKPGTAIVVVVRDSTAVNRRVVAADDVSLTLSEEQTPQSTETVARADIIEIQAPKRRSKARIRSDLFAVNADRVTLIEDCCPRCRVPALQARPARTVRALTFTARFDPASKRET